jgi:NAD+ kinase
MIVTPVAPVSGIARPAVVSALEPIQLKLLPESGHPALEVDGTVVRRMQPGETLDVRLRPQAGLVVRLDADRYQRRSAIKLSLMDLPFLPDEMRDLAPATDAVSLAAEE